VIEIHPEKHRAAEVWVLETLAVIGLELRGSKTPATTSVCPLSIFGDRIFATGDAVPSGFTSSVIE